MLLMLIVLRNRGDNEIMRVAIAALVIVVAYSSSCSLSSSVDKATDPGGGRNTLHGHAEYGTPTLVLMDSYPIMGNPVWSPVASSLGVPTLTNGPGNGPLAQNRFNTPSQRGVSSLLPYFARTPNK